MNQFLKLTAALLAALTVMIFHELPKSFVYNYKRGKKEPVSSLLYLPQYIDPIGLIFATFLHAGFSKPYRFVFDSKKRAFLIGLTGFFSLIVYFLLGLLVYKGLFSGVDIESLLLSQQYKVKFTYWYVCYFILNSLGMFIVNIFPISVFNMGLCVAGISLPRFVAIVRKDGLTKFLLWVALYIQSITNLSLQFVNFILRID